METFTTEEILKQAPHLRKVILDAEFQMSQGRQVFFKWTCQGCGARQTYDVPNSFYLEGTCEECRFVTNLLKPAADVSFLLVAIFGPPLRRHHAQTQH